MALKHVVKVVDFFFNSEPNRNQNQNHFGRYRSRTTTKDTDAYLYSFQLDLFWILLELDFSNFLAQLHFTLVPVTICLQYLFYSSSLILLTLWSTQIDLVTSVKKLLSRVIN